MDEIKINKNLLLIFRLLMALVGAAVGVTAIWHVFAFNPDLVRSAGLRAVFYFACGALPAAVMLLTAAPLLHLVLSLCEKIKGVNFTNKAEDKEEAKSDADEREYTGENGYVLSAGAFGSDRVVNMCENWLVGEIFVLKSTADAFGKTMDKDPVSADAARRLDALIKSGKVKIADFGGETENDDDGVISFAFEKNLKIIVGNRNAIKETSYPVHLLALDEL